MKISNNTFIGVVETVMTKAGLRRLTQFAPKVDSLLRAATEDFIDEDVTQHSECDVCKKTHVRKQFFVFAVSVRDCSEIFLVGRSCLGNLKRGADSTKLAKKLEEFLQTNSIDRLGRIDLQIYLSWVASYVERHGWVSKKTRRNMDNDVTANAVWKMLAPEPAIYQLRYAELSHMNDLKRRELQPREWHNDDALFAIQDVLDYPEELMNGSSYHANLNAVARAGYVDEQTCGLAANILREYQKKEAKLEG